MNFVRHFPRNFDLPFFHLFLLFRERKKAHKHKLLALVNVQMALGQTAGCPRVNRAKKFMCSPRNTASINFSLWLTGGLSQGCPDFQKVYVFKVYVPFSCPSLSGPILRDTARLSQRYPPIARYGVFGVSTWPIGCDTPSLFSERFPLGVHAK